MSAHVRLVCDQQWRYGACPTFLAVDASTVAEARRAAEADGWRCGTAGDFCQEHSGRPRPRSFPSVAVLHPKEPTS